MNFSDLQIGMRLNNDGPGNVRIYDSKDATGTPELTISPKQYIGQIVDLLPGGVVAFYSDQIKSSAGFVEQGLNYINSLLPGVGDIIAGTVNFSDLQNNVTDAQVQAQASMIAAAAANGVSLKNSFIKAGQGVGETIESIIPWKLVMLLGAGYVVVNWNTFFKSKQL